MKRSRTLVVAVCLVASLVGSASATAGAAVPGGRLGWWMTEGDQLGAWYGWSTGSAGDVNADGYNDVVVGAFGASGAVFNEGKAYAYLGSAAGLSRTPAWTVESDRRAHVRLVGCRRG